MTVTSISHTGVNVFLQCGTKQNMLKIKFKMELGANGLAHLAPYNGTPKKCFTKTHKLSG